jgi:hypothetical protein
MAAAEEKPTAIDTGLSDHAQRRRYQASDPTSCGIPTGKSRPADIRTQLFIVLLVYVLRIQRKGHLARYSLPGKRHRLSASR